MMTLNRTKYILSIICLGGMLSGLSPLWGDTVIWKPTGAEAGFYLDVPPDWEKDYEVKKNGVIFSAVNGGLSITVKSYVSDTLISAREVLNGRAAHLSGRYSYISLMREKVLGDDAWGVIAYWKLRQRKKNYLEKTVIYVKENTVLMLICSGPENEFENSKIIFDNAILSFGYYDPDLQLDPGVIRYEMSPPAVAPPPPVTEESVSPQSSTVEESASEQPSGTNETGKEESKKEEARLYDSEAEETAAESSPKEDDEDEEDSDWKKSNDAGVDQW